MQAEIQTKVKISVSEIKKILAEKFCLYHDFEVEIVEYSVVESESVNEENNGWIDVPKDWKHSRCPTASECEAEIDIIQRNGAKHYNLWADELDVLWPQDNRCGDIVKYRLSKQSN